MKRFFTLTFLLHFFVLSLIGQSLRFQVDSPAGIASAYDFSPAAFGGSFDYDITGELIFIDDGTAAPTEGCNAATNDLTGKIAVIDRGSCEFGVKVLSAQNAGAIAAIVCNNAGADEDRGGLVSMQGGAVGNQVTIPSIFLTKESCATIRVEIPGAIVSFLTQYDENENALWGTNSTEGDFKTGMNGWTTTGISAATALWEWDSLGSAEKGGFGTAADHIVSPSSNNGAMVFNSDFLDNAGDTTNIGMGTSPAPHMGELISPVMDLSSAAEVSLRFNQYYRNKNSKTWVAFSTDSGATWSDPTQVNEGVGAEQATAQRSIQTIYLEGLGGSATAQIKFIFDGSLYFWIIDDVKLIEAELYSSRISAYLFPPANFGTPVSMIEGDSMFFSSLVSNNGEKEITNMKLTGQIIGGESVLYEDSAKLETLPVSYQDSSLFINGGFEAPALEVGNYVARYDLNQDNGEYNPSDNVVALPFEITESTFQKDDGVIVQATRTTANTAYEYGNLYYVRNGGFKATTCTFSTAVNTGTDLSGQSFLIKLYKIVEDNNPDAFTDDDVELVGIANEVFPDDYTSFALYTVELLDFNSLDPGVILEEDTEYILMFTYAGSDEIFTSYAEVEYGNRIVDVLRVEGGQGGPWFLGGFSGPTVPIVRMEIDLVSSTKEPELAENKFKLYPNPTVEEITLDLDLNENSKNVTLLIRDLNGSTIRQMDYKNIQKQSFNINTSNLRSGLFILTIRTDEGVRSQKFMVMKVR